VLQKGCNSNSAGSIAMKIIMIYLIDFSETRYDLNDSDIEVEVEDYL
jgi:hypothetical protein